MQKIIPNLWFDSQAEEAAKLYTSLFRNSRIGRTTRCGQGEERRFSETKSIKEMRP